MTGRRLWLIDASYLFNARHSVAGGYRFSYLKLRQKLEEEGALWRAYYLNSVSNAGSGADDFHGWLRSALPTGPQLITQLYRTTEEPAHKAYCDVCGERVALVCPKQTARDRTHRLSNEVQKGVDVGLATLALIHRDNYDTLLLSTGDSDLLDAVSFLADHGKRIELVVFQQGVSTELQCRADRIHWINNFAGDVEYTNGHPAGER